MMYEWAKEMNCNVTVCDTEGKIILKELLATCRCSSHPGTSLPCALTTRWQGRFNSFVTL